MNKATITGKQLRDWIKLGLAGAVEGTGLGFVARALRTATTGARIHVLGYHRVVDRIDFAGPVNPSLCITADAFRRQMEQLRDRFVVLPLSYVMRAVAGELELGHDAVAVTFDDGYRDVILRADPILSALEIPALASVALVMLVVSALVLYEVMRFAETRDRVRHRVAGGRVAE